MLLILNNKDYCLQCGKSTPLDRKFCSKECKSKSQIKRITLKCVGCGKTFRLSPYLKRKTNYCSIECYWNSTRRKELKNCRVCGKNFWATKPQIDHGFGVFCSRRCQYKTYPSRIKKICAQCHENYWVPPSWAERGNYCSKKCHDDSMRDYVKSVCRKCGKEFELPRSDLNRGRGNFCAYRCYLTYRGPSTLEEKMERSLNLIGIKFEREIKFKRFHVDFLLENLKTVIECDGEYWHLSLKIQERDKRKDKLLNGLGYKVLRFSGKTMDKLSDKSLANLLVKRLYNPFNEYKTKVK